MNTKKRVILNSIVLYIKVILSMALTLVAMPLILKALGASDYGLYNLLAGIVGMLYFLNNSLSVSSQRYISVYMGTGDYHKINLVYNTSFYLHCLLGVGIIILLEAGALFIGELNIEPNRLGTANIIYQLLIVTTFFRIISVPYDAIMNAHEDMVEFAIIELIDSLILLFIAIMIAFVPYDKLVFYSLSVSFTAVLNFLLKCLWCRYKYKKYRIRLFANKKELLTKEMSGFAGWNLFGGLAVMGRNQGVAIIINLFLGTISNAAYGIANQINGAMSSFSGTFQRAINPQLMKSEGMNDRPRLFRISNLTSKYSVLALSFFSIPLIIVMPEALGLWLKEDIPTFTMELCRCILIMTIVYQYSQGIMSAIQAVGDIKRYQIVMGTIILLNLPIAYVLLKFGLPVYCITICYIVLELVSLIVRLILAKNLMSMPINDFINGVVRPTTVVLLIPTLIAYGAYTMLSGAWLKVIMSCFIFAACFFIMMWFFDFNKDQRKKIATKVKSLFVINTNT